MNYKCEQIIYNLTKKHKIVSILVAISGGQDSIVLIKKIENFHYMHSLYNIEYIYIDHQWKQDSLKQIEHIINYLKHLNKKLNIYQIKQFTLSEHICRQYRYHIMINHAIISQHTAIITAHTKTDKLETFLLHILRGTSLEGATSLTIHRQLNNYIHIIRPLLHYNRIQLNWFCRYLYLPVWSDITNHNYRIKRNRIRYELIPYLIKYYNNNLESNLNIFLKTCFNDNEYIQKKIIQLYISFSHNQYIALNYADMNKEHTSIKSRLLKLFIYHNFYTILPYKISIQLIKILNNNCLGQTIKWQHLELKKTYKWLYIKFKE